MEMICLFDMENVLESDVRFNVTIKCVIQN